MQSGKAIVRGAVLATAVFGLAPAAKAATVVPGAVRPSSLTLQAEYAGSVALPHGRNNIAEPVAIDGMLYVVNQGARTITIAGQAGTPVLDATALPAGVTLESRAGIINMAGTADRVFVGFHSSTLPEGFADPAPLPSDAGYSPRRRATT